MEKRPAFCPPEANQLFEALGFASFLGSSDRMFIGLDQRLDAHYSDEPKFCLVAVGIEDIVEREYQWDKTRFLQFSSHTIVNPISQALSYLDKVDPSLQSNKRLLRAKTRLRRALREAKTLLAVAAAEQPVVETGGQVFTFSPKRKLLDYLTEVQQCREVEEQEPLLIESDGLSDVEIEVVSPDLADVLFAALINNAIDHIDEALRSGMKRSDCGLKVATEAFKGSCLIAIQNGGAPVSTEKIRQLNAVTPEDQIWRVSRKGDQHYGLGTRKARWIARRLGGRLEFSTNASGHFVASVYLPLKGVLS